MPYRMEEVSDNIRIGVMSNGNINVEVWGNPRGWRTSVDEEPLDLVLSPNDAYDLFEYLRKNV